MNVVNGEGEFSRNLDRALSCILVIVGFILGLTRAEASAPILPGGGGTNSSPYYTNLDAWSFNDSGTWKSDKGYFPVSFTNLAFSYLGNGSSLVVDTNVPAWLQFNIVETNGAVNFSPSVGTLSFWFAAGSWSGTNIGGTGPGEFGRLFEVGSYTTNSSCGLWSLYVDDVGANLYFSTQTNDLSGTLTTYLSAPISWTTNYFHNVVLTYSATKTALYIDGSFVTNGPGLTVYPGPDVLANGLFIGSDSNGVYQAHGLFNDVVTYNVPLDADTISQTFARQYTYYTISPLNVAMFSLTSAGSSPSYTPTYDAVTGQGNLQVVGSVASCISSTNVYQVWLTNITSTTASDGTMTVTFSIVGGQDNYNYDVFAGCALTSPISNGYWTWQGQGPHCQTYSLTGMPQGTVFLVLGTPLDSDGDGLTDAFEKLVTKTNPYNPDTNGDGISDSDEYLLKLSSSVPNPVLPINPVIQTCPQ
jgi:hypothetical protein